MSEVKLGKNESVDRAMKRLRKIIDKEGTLKKVREKRYYEKPSVKNKRRKNKAKFEAYLQAKRDKRWR